MEESFPRFSDFCFETVVLVRSLFMIYMSHHFNSFIIFVDFEKIKNLRTTPQ